VQWVWGGVYEQCGGCASSDSGEAPESSPDIPKNVE